MIDIKKAINVIQKSAIMILTVVASSKGGAGWVILPFIPEYAYIYLCHIGVLDDHMDEKVRKQLVKAINGAISEVSEHALPKNYKLLMEFVSDKLKGVEMKDPSSLALNKLDSTIEEICNDRSFWNENYFSKTEIHGIGEKFYTSFLTEVKKQDELFRCVTLSSLEQINTELTAYKIEFTEFKKIVEVLIAQNKKAYVELCTLLPSNCTGYFSRSEILEEIDKTLKKGNPLFILSGQGGMGKSEVAKEYASTHKNEYSKVCFVYYKSNLHDTIINGLSWVVSNENNLSYEQECQLKINYIKTQAENVLFVIDDAKEITERKDFELLTMILQKNKVLVTSRWNQVGETEGVPIDPMDETILIQLFAKNSKTTQSFIEKNRNIINKIIIDVFKKNTLLVVLAAKLYYASGIGLEEMHGVLKNDRLAESITEKIKNFKDSDRAGLEGKPIDNTLYCHVLALYSIADLVKQEPKIEILRNMSLIPYSGISRDQFKKWLGLDNTDEINYLVDSGWIELDIENKCIAMHPIISDAVYMQTNPTSFNCLKLLSVIISGLSYGEYEIPKEKLYFLEYGQFAASRIKDTSRIKADIHFHVGRLLNFIANYTLALDALNEALEVGEKVLGKEHPSTATTYNNIAGVYDSQGDYPKALEWYQKDLAISEKVLGKDHPDTATAYNNIALVYSRQGDYPKALEWYQKALAIREKVLGKDHPSTATTYNKIAEVY